MTAEPLDYFEELTNHLQGENVLYRIDDYKLKVKFEAQIPTSKRAVPTEENKTEENKTEEPAMRNVKVVIQVLSVGENKNCVKFKYTDPQTKADMNKVNTVVEHFIRIRDALKLRMFCDTTFEEAQ
jgi:hypothetical protein